MREYYQKIIKNNNQGKISVSNMQMTTPYYPESALAKSKFYGFYTLFYMFTVYFSLVYPALNYIKTGTFFQKAFFKVFETNIMWDIKSVFIFLIISLCFMSVSSFTKAICKKLTKRQATLLFIPVIGILWSIYVGIGFNIVRNYPMYFTDKIFIVVMSWAFFIKTLSYIFDMHQIVEITQKFQVRRNQSAAPASQESIEQLKQLAFLKKSSNLLQQSPAQKIKIKIIYLLSPEIVFKNFVFNYDSTLFVHPIYIINKILVALVCSLVNLIIMIEMIEPLCSKQSLQKYQFIELFFRLIPPIFYVNICLYFMILESIIPAIAEATKMKNRIYYQNWWNAQTLYDFLDRWVLVINTFTQQYLTAIWVNIKLRQTLHVAIILFLIFQIFSIQERHISVIPFLGLSVTILICTYFLGGIQRIQNNYVVHMIIFSFSPLMLAIQMKYNVFSGQNN